MSARDPDVSAPEARTNDAVGATTGAAVVGAGLWHLAAKVLPQAYALVISVAAARVLGPEGMGQQSFISFVQLSVVLLFTGGLSASLMRHTAEVVGQGRADVVRGLLRWAWRILAVGALVGTALLVTFGLVRADLQAAWMLAAAAGGLAVLHAVPSSVLTGLQRWREASIISMVTGLVGAAGTLGVLQAGGGIAGMFAVELVVTAAALAWTSLTLRRSVRALPTGGATAPDRELRRRVVRYAGGAWLQLALHLVVWKRSELFVLDWTSTDTEIAMYSVAFATLSAVKVIPGALASTLAPAVATLFGAGELQRISRGFSRGGRLLGVAALPLAAGLLALGPLLLRTVYGEAYAAAGTVLVIMAVTLPILPVNTMCSGLLHGLGRIRPIVTSSVAATVVNVALAVTLIPPHGARGAAVANGAAQVTATVLMLRAVLAQLPPVRFRWRPLVVTATASAGCGIVAFVVGEGLGGPAGIAGGVASGVAVFAGLALLLRILPAEDAAWIEESFGTRLRGLVGWAARALTERPAKREGADHGA